MAVCVCSERSGRTLVDNDLALSSDDDDDDGDDDDADGAESQLQHPCVQLLVQLPAHRKVKSKKNKEGYSSLQASLPSPLRELTYHMGSHSVICHPTEVTFPPLPQPKLVLDLATPEGCKAELT